MRTSSHARLIAALTLALTPLLAACSSHDDTTRVLALDSEPALGRVSLAIAQNDVDVDSVTYRVIDPAGDELLGGELDVTAADAEIAIDFAAPAGEGYRVYLTARTSLGARCSAASSFDVAAGERSEVHVELACEQGLTSVVGTIVSTPSCPDVALSAPTLQARVGAPLSLSAGATGPGAPTYRWSASAGTLDTPDAAQATFTCASAGAVTVTLTATLGDCSSSSELTLTCVADAPPADACAGLGSNCHVVDPGSGPLHECHELGHAGDLLACSAERSACVTSCGEALCQTLGSLCHEVDPGSGPLHECHELGHAADAAACFARGRECFDLCTAAHEARARVPVTLAFAAKVGSAAFACGTSYPGVGLTSATVEPQDFRFYVQDVRLITSEGAEVPVVLDERTPWQANGVALLDFEDAQGACFSGDAETNVSVTGTVPPDEYTGVVFSNGVPEALSHADPATLPAPLQVGSMSWGWLLGFRFMRAELVQVAEADTIPGLGLVHVGSSACSGNPQAGSVSCARANRNEVRLSDFDPATSTIVADIGALFADTDLAGNNQCHGSGDACAAPFANLGVNLVTGAPSAAQTIFRVE